MVRSYYLTWDGKLECNWCGAIRDTKQKMLNHLKKEHGRGKHTRRR